jgi:protein-S-isoprenylcysteine O-methyltransferase Ste14
VTLRLFRVARPAGPVKNVTKTLVQLVTVWGFALGLLPWLAVTAEDAIGLSHWSWPGRVALGLVTFVAGSAFGIASAWVMAIVGQGTPVPFDAARELVIAGPYRIIRNPMATSATVQLGGVAAMYGSATVLLLAVGGGVLWNVAIRPGEERFLADRFGDAYEAYRATVRCWVPRRTPYSPPG